MSISMQSETQKIPKLRFSGGWEEKNLGEVCDVKGGKRIPFEFTVKIPPTSSDGIRHNIV